MKATPGTVRRGALLGLLLSAALLACAPELLVRAGELQYRWEGRAGEPLVCSFRARTGYACLGCGGTRALRLASQGRLGEALQANALGAWAGLGLWGTALLAAAAAFSGRLPSWRLLVIGYTASGLLMFVWAFITWIRRLPPGAAGFS